MDLGAQPGDDPDSGDSHRGPGRGERGALRFGPLTADQMRQISDILGESVGKWRL